MSERELYSLDDLLTHPKVLRVIDNINPESAERRTYSPPKCAAFDKPCTVLTDTDQYNFTLDKAAAKQLPNLIENKVQIIEGVDDGDAALIEQYGRRRNIGIVFSGGGARFEPKVPPATVHIIALDGIVAVHNRGHVRRHIGQSGPMAHELDAPETRKHFRKRLGLVFDIVGGGLGRVVWPGIHMRTGGNLAFQCLVGIGMIGTRRDHVVQDRFQRLGHHGLDGQNADG